MQLKDKVAVVTGGGNGIGRALCQRFAAEGARGIVVADRDAAAARQLAEDIDALAVTVDVASEADIRRLVDETIQQFGRIDLFCSNAGVAEGGGIETPDDEWNKIWNIHLMAHVYASRAVLPAMLERGSGYLLHTASAAGLLTQIGSAPYSVTKHAAVSFAEWLSIMYGPTIKVSCLCPQGVTTNMILREDADPSVEFLRAEAITAEAVAEAVIEGLAAEKFLILPHPEVSSYFMRKASDYDRWIRGMRRLRDQIQTAGESKPKPE